MKYIVTVVGKDRIGIIAHVCQVLAKHQVNILDISQTILQGYFNMIMIVETDPEKIVFDDLHAAFNATQEELGVQIKIQREDIFESMHRV